MNRTAAIFLSFLGLVAAPSVEAEQARSFGDYTVHYSAFSTDILTPEVAKAYQITRSKNRALLNISVLKKVMGNTVQPVKAEVKATATNLSAQLRELDVRELSQDGAVYYIAQTSVDHGETLRYDVSVRPEGEESAFKFSFEQQFFTE
jgi:hypothetical protein